MGNERKKCVQKTKKQAAQHEDAAMKVVMQYFAEDLLPYWGIHGKVKSIAPTESVHLEIRKGYQDMNLIMEDGSWKHFEFQSSNEGVPGLKRFRLYEASVSQQFRTDVTTYVLYSGKIKNPVTEFSEGVNTYRVVPIIMQNDNADILLQELQEKLKTGAEITREELLRLVLTPLMGGESVLKERIKSAYHIVSESACLKTEEKSKLEAVIYAMADKFLESVEMEEIEEMMKMTRLGQKLFQNGVEEGESIGAEKAKLENAKNLLDILTVEVIAERIGLPLETVQKLKEESTDK